MLLLVISDLHLGRGRFLDNGEANILEDFDEEERFSQFLEFYNSEEFAQKEVHLVLNGDILNLIQIDLEGVFQHIITEEVTVAALNRIIDGHSLFFTSLRRFLSNPKKKLTYVIGNHDNGMAFPDAQKLFSEVVGRHVHFCMKININGVHIEHGHRFEVVNTVPPKEYFIEGPSGKKILNLPWGTMFCITLLPKFKKERPNIDKVRPFSTYLRWLVIHDTLFALRALTEIVKYFIKTGINEYTNRSRSIKKTFLFFQQITIHPKYEKQARRILNKDSRIKVVVMGHTHLAEWRKFTQGRLYFNTGTWNNLPSTDAGIHTNDANLTYVKIEFSEDGKQIRNAALNIWQGKWRPFREEISLTN